MIISSGGCTSLVIPDGVFFGLFFTLQDFIPYQVYIICPLKALCRIEGCEQNPLEDYLKIP